MQKLMKLNNIFTYGSASLSEINVVHSKNNSKITDILLSHGNLINKIISI